MIICELSSFGLNDLRLIRRYDCTWLGTRKFKRSNIVSLQGQGWEDEEDQMTHSKCCWFEFLPCTYKLTWTYSNSNNILSALLVWTQSLILDVLKLRERRNKRELLGNCHLSWWLWKLVLPIYLLSRIFARLLFSLSNHPTIIIYIHEDKKENAFLFGYWSYRHACGKNTL